MLNCPIPVTLYLLLLYSYSEHIYSAVGILIGSNCPFVLVCDLSYMHCSFRVHAHVIILVQVVKLLLHKLVESAHCYVSIHCYVQSALSIHWSYYYSVFPNDSLFCQRFSNYMEPCTIHSVMCPSLHSFRLIIVDEYHYLT